MLKMLDKSINASGVQVFIGEESGFQILDEVSVVQNLKSRPAIR